MSNSSSEDQDEGAEELRQRPAHHPSAPSHEAFDISTTVDPSYVISLIRKLLPADAKDGEHATGTGSIGRELRTGVTKEESENGGEAEAMESSENHDKLDLQEPTNDYQNDGGSTEQTGKECGCILWDLAASEDHAQFMVQNLILEVLLATLVVSQSLRFTEISLGINGNLACHEISRKSITSVDGLVGSIVEKLFLDDVPCLCEACRVLSLCLQGGEGVTWAEALQLEHILARNLWIAENALNPKLIEKSVGLLLAVLESQQEVAAILIPPLLKLRLSSLLIKLLVFERNKLKEDRTLERQVDGFDSDAPLHQSGAIKGTKSARDGDVAMSILPYPTRLNLEQEQYTMPFFVWCLTRWQDLKSNMKGSGQEHVLTSIYRVERKGRLEVGGTHQLRGTCNELGIEFANLTEFKLSDRKWGMLQSAQTKMRNYGLYSDFNLEDKVVLKG